MSPTNYLGLDTTDLAAIDDKLITGEFHLVIDKPVQFVFRSADVIHSAYMPHFRAQMNCVPGLKTTFNFTPRLTTVEMREIVGDPEFEYILLCNKICGAAHYNMQMNIIVESQEDYDIWLAAQPQFMDAGADAKKELEKEVIASAE
jgi:cytochrome c oxidase subunit 2